MIIHYIILHFLHITCTSSHLVVFLFYFMFFKWKCQPTHLLCRNHLFTISTWFCTKCCAPRKSLCIECMFIVHTRLFMPCVIVYIYGLSDDDRMPILMMNGVRQVPANFRIFFFLRFNSPYANMLRFLLWYLCLGLCGRDKRPQKKSISMHKFLY